MTKAPVRPNKWAQFDPLETLALLQRHYPGFPLEKIYALPLETVHELLDAKAK